MITLMLLWHTNTLTHSNTNKFMIKWLDDPMFMKPINVCRLVHFLLLFCVLLLLLRLYFYELNEQKRNKKKLIHGMNEMNRHRLPSPGRKHYKLLLLLLQPHTTRNSVNVYYVLCDTDTRQIICVNQ